MNENGYSQMLKNCIITPILDKIYVKYLSKTGVIISFMQNITIDFKLKIVVIFCVK